MNSAKELRARKIEIEFQARAELDKAQVAGTDADHIEANVDRMLAEADALEARAKRYDDLEARDAAINAADARRPSEERKVETGDKAERENRAINTWLRTGDETELRAHSTGVGSEGGFLVPQTWAAEINRALKAYGPMNDDSVVTYLRTPTGATINHPANDDTANKGKRIAQNAQVGTTNVTFTTKPLDAYGYTTDAILVPRDLVQDSAYDLDSFIRSAAAERMARRINEDATIGDGVDDPNGLFTAATVGKTAASATAIASDEILDLIHSVDLAYRGKASFMFNDATLLALRKLKDTDGRYLWQPSLQAGVASTLYGYAYHINQDAPSIATGAKSIVFGDMKSYVIRQVQGFEMVRLVERYADYKQIGFIGYARYDGDLMNSKAVKALAQA